MNKGVFCISTLSPTSSPPSLTFYYELLGDWQKRKSCPALDVPLSLPSSTDPSIHPSIHPCLPSVPRTRLCFFCFLIKRALAVFPRSLMPRLVLPYNVGGVWVIGFAHKHALSAFIRSFSLSLRSFIHTERDGGLEVDGCSSLFAPSNIWFAPPVSSMCSCLWSRINYWHCVHTAKSRIHQPPPSPPPPPL